MVEIRLVETYHFIHLQTFCNFLKQLAASLWKTVNIATDFSVVNKFSQVMLTHPDFSLLEQVVVKCQRTYYNVHVFGCVDKIPRFEFEQTIPALIVLTRPKLKN